MKERNTAFDIFKAFACFGVVFMHCKFPEPFDVGGRSLGCFAVPLFFCISGYYLTASDRIDPASMVRKLRHIVHLIIGSEIFYVLFAVIYHHLSDAAKRAAFWEKYFYPGAIAKWFLLNQPPVYAHLWFLYALATMYLVIILFFKTKKQLKFASILVPILLFGIIMMQEFNSLHLVRNQIQIPGAESPLYLSSTFVFRTIPFFLLGVMLSEWTDRIRQIQIPAAAFFVMIILGECMAVYESYHFGNAQFFVGSMITMISIMLYSIKMPHLKNKVLQYIGNQLSTYVYIVHMAVAHTMNYCLGKLHLSGNMMIKWAKPLLVLGVSLMISIIIVFLQNSWKNRMKCPDKNMQG